ncbi:hypothetical protein EIP91_002203 [Steccherinum ochraceum]|uniref:Uncharacterized protein n=1 Tax=Steccherinum ochraceum TaxID=92696 RepID=A0A4R0RCL7_9APHY|nr:hypothetical protein EIP91_002203 [Steccherinum ochraceum]
MQNLGQKNLHLHPPALSSDEQRILAEIIPDLVQAIEHPDSSVSRTDPRNKTKFDPPVMAEVLPNLMQAIESSSGTFADLIGVSGFKESMPRSERVRAELCELAKKMSPRKWKEDAENPNGVGPCLRNLDAANEYMANFMLDAWVRLLLARKCLRYVSAIASKRVETYQVVDAQT